MRLYNTLTRRKEPFRPIDPANVRMYACGPTVYDDAHIGNARPIIVFDVLFRVLRQVYGEASVTYVRNITDVDDKINARAAERGVSIRELTDVTARRFHEDIRALGVLMPGQVNVAGAPPRFIEPRATDHIAEMRELIERLLARGIAYVAEDHVLFSVAAMGRKPGAPRYGALANRSLDEMLAGARVEVAPYKRDPMDFVLWKPSKPGEPSWPSPGGITTPGRPGWHIECSAMSWKHLIQGFAGRVTCDPADANVFDIHAGGIDLVFPHHEDEIAQSCCALDTPRMANYWLHNGFLQVEGQKMSKSLGNFVTIRDLLTSGKFGGPWAGPVIRWAMLETHYRQPIDWTEKRLARAQSELESVAGAIGALQGRFFAGCGESLRNWLRGLDAAPPEPFLAFLADDLNTPGAIAWARGLMGRMGSDLEAAGLVVRALSFLGIIDRTAPLALAAPLGCGQFSPETGMFGFSMSRIWRTAYVNNDRRLLEQTTGQLARRKIAIEADENGLVQFRAEADDDPALARVNALVAARAEARARKDWAEADRIRDELAAMGAVVKDTKDGGVTIEWTAPRTGG
ncbi:cysteine--tRNA ligase [Camelimonas abortus]|uniref:Cysteine--tRNA ligase n=1 Tax=Camelimonas abortus TaxID=1017184 RepID=A0ABV7LEV1_9HYPH